MGIIDRNFVTDGIVGPFPVLDSVREVRMKFRADNDDGITFVLNQNTQRILEDIIEDIDVAHMDLPDAASALTKAIKEAWPRLCDDFNQRPFHLEEVIIEEPHVRESENNYNVVFHDIFAHTHDPKIGPASEYHDHNVRVRLSFGETAGAISKDQRAQTRRVVSDFFNQGRDYFSGMCLETASRELFNTLADGSNRADLHAISLTIDYDGSLDHPTQRMEFITALD